MNQTLEDQETLDRIFYEAQLEQDHLDSDPEYLAWLEKVSNATGNSK